MRSVEPWVTPPLERFLAESSARLTLLMTSSGQVVAQHGFVRSVDVMTAAALGAAILASTGEIGRLVGESRFHALVHQGTRQQYRERRQHRSQRAGEQTGVGRREDQSGHREGCDRREQCEQRRVQSRRAGQPHNDGATHRCRAPNRAPASVPRSRHRTFLPRTQKSCTATHSRIASAPQ